MTTFVEDIDRKVVPGWRDSLTTAAIGELDSLESPTQMKLSSRDFFSEKLAEWKTHKTFSRAAELVSSAIVLKREDEAVEAAETILQAREKSSLTIRSLAKLIVPSSEELNEIFSAPQTPNDPKRAIRVFRKRLRNEPRNSLVWVDLARQYTILGHTQKAKHAIRCALASAPLNRFVLRSAVRFYLHLDKPERALFLLRKAGRTPYDPWLLAAEISVAEIVNHTSKFIKVACRMLKAQKQDPRHLTELAATIATIELGAGSRKKARKFFVQSLFAPNDNSIAQLAWASRRTHGAFEFKTSFLEKPRTFEAGAWTHFEKGDWPRALEQAVNWLGDQPFSTRPSILGSYVGILIEDYPKTIEVAKAGLRANPNDFDLLNNLVVGLVRSGSLDKAKEIHAKIKSLSLSVNERVVWLATSGLLEYHKKNTEAARALYLEALETAPPNSKLKTLAALYFALYTVQYENPEDWLRTVELAQALAREHVEDADTIELLGRLQMQVERSQAK